MNRANIKQSKQSKIQQSSHSTITEEEVQAAQIAWGNGIIAIGAATNYQQAARAHLNQFYAFDTHTVLFKPTQASKVQFRGSKEAALSYFVGGCYEEDRGFALTPFIKVRWENSGIIIHQGTALAMGNYYFTNAQEQEIKVEFSFAYIKDAQGQLKIHLHHSSMPYHDNK